METRSTPSATDATSVAVQDRRWARPELVGEVALIVVVYLGYRHVRHLARDQADEAFENARLVVEIERRLNVFTELAVQRFFLHQDDVMWLVNHYYARVHFPLTITFLVWLILRHRPVYRMVRTWLIVVTLTALMMHVAFPLAPPRMLPTLGFVDTLRESGLRIYSTNPNDSVANQFAAMPSLHFGWSVIVATGFVAVRRTPSSVFAFVHPVITLVAIVATANHYWIDAGIALALVVGAFVLVRAIERGQLHRAIRRWRASGRVRVPWVWAPTGPGSRRAWIDRSGHGGAEQRADPEGDDHRQRPAGDESYGRGAPG